MRQPQDDPDRHPVIVVAEDEPLLRLTAADQLERDGYRVIEVGSAAEALEVLASREEVQVLFTDIDMPGDLNGLELAREVHDRWPDVLLLVTSGRVSLEDSDVPDDGMFIAKPYAATGLAGALKELKRRHER
ncbi:MAG: response regulator receiver protein [Enterovirga sp.]|nr:response regulator receiver protein [Enterovirga sp.]